MEMRQLGRTDMIVGTLGFGGAEIGFEGVEPETVNRMLNSALDSGLNLIDTAECYENSEQLIGRAVAHRRSEFYLLTKCGHSDGWTRSNWSQTALLTSIRRSLTRLRTDYVDVIQLHSCSEEVLRKGAAIGALLKAKENGYTRYCGYSGDGRAALYAINSGVFDVIQLSINIADQEAVETLMPIAVSRHLGIIAKRSIANAIWKESARPPSSYDQPYWYRLNELSYPFIMKSLAFAVATALQFTLSVPGVHSALVGTSKESRWQENRAMLDANKMSAEEFAAIRSRWKEISKGRWRSEI
ncbi:MAG TPA: aldo/keto reductase [Acidisarcina sp.]